jgi:hypothetical protein
MRAVDVRGGTIPGTDQALLVQDKAEFAANNPSMITFPFLAHLGRTTPFSHGVNHLDAIAVSDTQHGERCQTAAGPRRVGLAETRQAGTLWHVREQRQIIACQPSGECSYPLPLMANSKARVTTSLEYSWIVITCAPLR